MRKGFRYLWRRMVITALDRFAAESAKLRMKPIGTDAGHAVATCTSSVESVVKSLPVFWTFAHPAVKTIIITGMFPRKHGFRSCGANCPS